MRFSFPDSVALSSANGYPGESEQYSQPAERPLLGFFMRIPVGLFALAAVFVVGWWWWLGAPVAMPASPLAPGEKLYCVSYAPFRADQSPLDPSVRVEPWQIEDDLTRLSAITDCVRTYSTEFGLDRIAEIAQRHGMKVLQGLWLSGDAEKSRREVEEVIALAKRFPDVIRGIVVGNEVLLRGEMSAVDLVQTLRNVKSQVSMSVTYADVWEFWLRNRELAQVADFVTIHILPYWEDVPISAKDAAAHVEAIRKRVAAAFPGKEILIGETGWPSRGRMREGALPSPASQARVMHEVLTLAKRENHRVNLIEAFDQPWKRYFEGTVGGHWGLLDAVNRQPKFVWGEAVSNHPYWRWQALGGVAFAGLVFASALGRRRRGWDVPDASVYIGVTVSAITGGALLGWAIENVAVESLGVGGWIRSLAMAAVALAGPPLAAAALAAGKPVPSFGKVLARAEDRPRDRLALLLGIVLITLTVLALQKALGLVFDARYLDFPFAALSAAAVPYLLLSILGKRITGRLGHAERVAAGVLGASAVFIVFNESFANWQALWFCAVLVGIAVILLRLRDAPGSE
jgi:glucan 1,3-beta-glucosidase